MNNTSKLSGKETGKNQETTGYGLPLNKGGSVPATLVTFFLDVTCLIRLVVYYIRYLFAGRHKFSLL